MGFQIGDRVGLIQDNGAHRAGEHGTVKSLVRLVKDGSV